MFTKITPLTSSVVSPFQHTKLSNQNRIMKSNLPTIQTEEEEEAQYWQKVIAQQVTII